MIADMSKAYVTPRRLRKRREIMGTAANTSTGIQLPKKVDHRCSARLSMAMLPIKKSSTSVTVTRSTAKVTAHRELCLALTLGVKLGALLMRVRGGAAALGLRQTTQPFCTAGS